MRRLEDEGGFSLVEVIAAFTVLALSLIALFDGVSVAIRNDGVARLHAGIVADARSRLDGLGVSVALLDGITSGTTVDGIPWSQEVRRSDATSGRIGQVAYRVRLSYKSSRRAQAHEDVVIETYRLGTVPP